MKNDAMLLTNNLYIGHFGFYNIQGEGRGNNILNKAQSQSSDRYDVAYGIISCLEMSLLVPDVR